MPEKQVDFKTTPVSARDVVAKKEAALKEEALKEAAALKEQAELKAAEALKAAVTAKELDALKALDDFSEKAAGFFRSTGWQVDVQPFERALASGLIQPRTSNRLDCADGRTANEPGLPPGYALFGGFWAIPALLTKLSLGGLRQASELLSANGLEGVIHGDANGILNCGFFKLAQSNRLKSLERNVYLLASHEPVLEAILRTLPFKVQRLVLKGEHLENNLVMSFARGYTPSLDPHLFRVTADLVDALKIDRDRFLKLTEETANLMTEGILKHITIVRPPEKATPA